MWTIFDVQAALAALPHGTATDPVAAAAALNAQTVPAPLQAVPLGALQGVLLLSGDWAKIKARAAKTASNPPTDADQAIDVAIAAIDLVQSKATEVDAEHYPQFAEFLGVLATVGDVSSASQAAIAALAQPTATVPRWSPPVSVGDIQTAMRA